MCNTLALFSYIIIAQSLALAKNDVRSVSSTSCKSIPVNLSVDMTTQIILEQEPKVTLFADKKHFKIVTNAVSPRSLAIIPVIEQSELESFKINAVLPGPAALATALDQSFKTNLIVIFDHSNQVMFDLHFVEKSKTDKIVKVTQTFEPGCEL